MQASYNNVNGEIEIIQILKNQVAHLMRPHDWLL